MYQVIYYRLMREKRDNVKMAILQPFLAIFCQLYLYILQKRGLDGHFEMLTQSESKAMT